MLEVEGLDANGLMPLPEALARIGLNASQAEGGGPPIAAQEKRRHDLNSILMDERLRGKHA